MAHVNSNWPLFLTGLQHRFLMCRMIPQEHGASRKWGELQKHEIKMSEFRKIKLARENWGKEALFFSFYNMVVRINYKQGTASFL